MSDGLLFYASAILVGERGVLVRGAAGSGKSSLALELLEAGAPPAWLIADDRVSLALAGGRVVATAPAATAGLIEVRGVGIEHRRHVSPAQIHLVVDLLPADECPRLPEPADERVEVVGVTLPRVALPVGGGNGALRISAALRRHFS